MIGLGDVSERRLSRNFLNNYGGLVIRGDCLEEVVKKLKGKKARPLRPQIGNAAAVLPA